MRLQSIHYGTLSAMILVAVLTLGTSASAYAQNPTNAPSSGSLKGSLTSIQNDATDNNIHWIVSGVFKMTNVNNTTATTSAAAVTLNAIFYMIKTDGTSPHKHQVYDFKLTGGQPVHYI